MRRLPSLALVSLLLASALPSPLFAEPAFITATDGSTLVHSASGTRFPRTLAGFERSGEAALDPGGDYIGVAYRHALADGEPLTLRIAVVHVEGTSPKEHFIIAKPMALNGLTDVTTLSEGTYQRSGKGADGYLGIYNARDGERRIGVGLWTFDRGYWDLRGRVEFPTGKRDEAQAAVDAFVDAFVALGQPYIVPAK
ncbi:hypothetical protein [Sphingomonas cavernae]|uniref:Uncharacterized protein n=1 Tax=Sphingomonas cavernae TaxID=2320861 RepID=A0A418WSM3_9SPHN|nr:hypothetical protein [Sphingomonas cavernae]RJF94272.1 hypothetical protein D3876_05560 [Sphingomonas cavernae]